ncbi:hypothetical protein VKT23_009881 [Stygiomarasmius scandens]|uniref:Uncharacterized protein n=1 Tax=Marasmiellus scandens TaxID=2682957 RepID=A0ABR1JE89_9AGAR
MGEPPMRTTSDIVSPGDLPSILQEISCEVQKSSRHKIPLNELVRRLDALVANWTREYESKTQLPENNIFNEKLRILSQFLIGVKRFVVKHNARNWLCGPWKYQKDLREIEHYKKEADERMNSLNVQVSLILVEALSKQLPRQDGSLQAGNISQAPTNHSNGRSSLRDASTLPTSAQVHQGVVGEVIRLDSADTVPPSPASSPRPIEINMASSMRDTGVYGSAINGVGRDQANIANNGSVTSHNSMGSTTYVYKDCTFNYQCKTGSAPTS